MRYTLPPTTTKKVNLFEVTMPLLNSMFAEFKELSKKKPEGAVNKNKIKIINRLLAKCREVLESELSIEYLDLLEEDDVPQNSDVVLMLSQYNASME
ncbi:MAG: hypothetical protein ACLPYB_11455 [Desulfobaccales bacterium]